MGGDEPRDGGPERHTSARTGDRGYGNDPTGVRRRLGKAGSIRWPGRRQGPWKTLDAAPPVGGQHDCLCLSVLCVMAYFLWLVQQAKKDFESHVREHAVLVAEVIQLSARGSVFREGGRGNPRGLLATPPVLSTISIRWSPYTGRAGRLFRRGGLVGIGIQREGKTYVEGRRNGCKNHLSGCRPAPQLEHLAKEHLYLFSLEREAGPGVRDCRD